MLAKRCAQFLLLFVFTKNFELNWWNKENENFLFLYPSSLQKRANLLSTFRVSQQQRWRSCWILSTQRQFWSQWKMSRSFFPQRVCCSLKVSLGVPAGPAWILKTGLQPTDRVVTLRLDYGIKL